MIQVGNTGLYFNCGRKGLFEIYFQRGPVFERNRDYEGVNVDCSGEIFKFLVDRRNLFKVNPNRFLKNHEFMIKQAIEKEFERMSNTRILSGCIKCGVDKTEKNIIIDEEEEHVCCPPFGVESDWRLVSSDVRRNLNADNFVYTKDNPITFLKDFDLRSEYVYGLHMICKIKSIKNPIVKNGGYIQNCVVYDDNTSKTIRAQLDNNTAEFDKWHNGDKVELYGVFKEGCLLITAMELIEEKNPDIIVTNRNDETPGYSQWRNSIIQRDGACVCCGYDKHLEAHHLFGYKENPSLAINDGNGITLCKFCHEKYHSVYGLKDINPVDFVKFIKRFGVR